MPKFTLLELPAVKKEKIEFEQRPFVWRCYSCGKTSEETTFHTIRYWTDYGYEYDCGCDNCGSTETAEDGEGNPRCEQCGRYGWYCDDCGLTTCPECWEVWLTPVGEPEEHECLQCNPPDFVDV